MYIRMYDVGFGDCFKICDKNVLFVDFGSKDMKSTTYSSICNEICSESKKDFLLTHYHSDHYNGLKSYLDDVGEGKYVNGDFETIYLSDSLHANIKLGVLKEMKLLTAHLLITKKPDVINLLIAIAKSRSNVRFLHRGMTFGDSKNIVLWPDCEIKEELEITYPFCKSRFLNEGVITEISEYTESIDNFLVWIKDKIENNLENNIEEIDERGKKVLSDITALNDLRKRYRIRVRKYTVAIIEEDLNNQSIVFQNLESCNYNYLMTGDIIKTSLSRIIDNRTFLISIPMHNSYRVIKAPHHGTPTHYCNSLPYTKHMLISHGLNSKRNRIDVNYGNIMNTITDCSAGIATCDYFEKNGVTCNLTTPPCCMKHCFCFELDSSGKLIKRSHYKDII